MRGTLRRLSDGWRRARIIPADAGNTVLASAKPRGCPDHPRGCGEHSSELAMTSNVLGSSPRMRGTPWAWVRRAGRSGIIPADAGNTALDNHSSPPFKDHPRGCGEHSGHGCRRLWHLGSSPRMRGTRRNAHNQWAPWGIIPADAGNTSSQGWS